MTLKANTYIWIWK